MIPILVSFITLSSMYCAKTLCDISLKEEAAFNKRITQTGKSKAGVNAYVWLPSAKDIALAKQQATQKNTSISLSTASLSRKKTTETITNVPLQKTTTTTEKELAKQLPAQTTATPQATLEKQSATTAAPAKQGRKAYPGK